MFTSYSQEDYLNHGGLDPLRGTKKKRLQGACDTCRKRKIRCDRAVRGGECTNCISFNIHCTVALGKGRRTKGRNTIDQQGQAQLETLTPKQEKRTPELAHRSSPHSTPEAISTSYTDLKPLISSILEDEEAFFTNTDAYTIRHSLVRLAHHARSLHEQDEQQALSHLPVDHGSPESDGSGASSSRVSSRTKVIPPRRQAHKWHVGLSALLEEQPQEEGDDDDAEDAAVDDIAAHLDSLNLDPNTRRFYGRSSDISMINMTLRLQSETLGDLHPQLEPPGKRPVFWWQFMQVKSDVHLARQTELVFPEPDLMGSLIELYFDKVNYLVPTLHKPTFLRLVEEGVHHQDVMFGALVLAACALGAAAGSDDPRMLAHDAGLPVARGLDYVRQIWQIRKGLNAPCTLYEIQLLCTISHIFYAGEGIYTMIGTGVRYMQELGVHRMNGTSSTSVEGELWRRAFWTFLAMDRIIASMTGRPCCVQDEDHDLEWPREVDDEFWEDAEHPWKQPADKLSNVQFFTQFIKLCNIEGNAQRTIYANKKPRVFRNIKDEDWQRRVILELDSELNQFQVELPAHLRWDPKTISSQPRDFLIQAGSLNTYLHFVRIQIHRPFVMNQGPVIGPSLPLLISTNAAHSVCNTLDAMNQAGIIVNPIFQNTAICAGVILLLNMWSSMRYRRSVDWAKEMDYVERLMGALKSAESRWAPAGQIWDLLNGLRWTPINETELNYRGEQLQRVVNQPRPVARRSSPTQAFQYEQTGSHSDYSSEQSTPQSTSSQASSSVSSSLQGSIGGYYRQAAPTAADSSSHAPAPAPTTSHHTDGRHLAPLHLTQPAYYTEQPIAGHDIPSSFGGLDESHLVDTSQHWDLGAYRLTYSDYNQYGQQNYHAEAHLPQNQQHQYSVHAQGRTSAYAGPTQWDPNAVTNHPGPLHGGSYHAPR